MGFDPMTSAMASAAEAARCGGKALLANALCDARRRSLSIFDAYEAALGPGLRVPCRPELNPPLWELGHIGWFADWWLARYPQRERGVNADPVAARLPARQAARGIDADALYHSSVVPHDTRWQLALPDAQAVRADLTDSLQDTLALLAEAAEDDQGLYFFRLALFHEDMHTEAAIYMAQTLGFDPRAGDDGPSSGGASDRLRVNGAEVTLGRPGPGFAFDNELGPIQQRVEGFEIDARAITWAQFLPFVDSGGHATRRFWSDAGWAWRQASGLAAPRYLRERNGQWERQRHGAWQPLETGRAACHLSAFEAQAWCAWAGRRLPTEAEWTLAAQDPRLISGEVWEWTASPFAPLPGFVPHPYADYSAPWFDGRPVLKGASAATAPRMRHPHYRNFFPPGRNDIFAGFRSVAAGRAADPARTAARSVGTSTASGW